MTADAKWFCRAYDPNKGRGCGSLMTLTPGGWVCPRCSGRGASTARLAPLPERRPVPVEA